MAVYRITAPDGGEYEITAPDDATEEQVLAYAQQNYQSAAQPPKPDFSNVTSTPVTTQQAPHESRATEGMSTGQRVLAGIGKSFADTGRGLHQLGAAAADQIPGVDLSGYRQNLQREIDRSKALDADLMNTTGGMAGNVIGYGAQVLLPAAGLRGLGAAKAFLPTTIAGNAAQGAALGGLQPVASGENRLANIALGGAFGAGGAALGRLAGNVGRRAKEAVAPGVRDVYEAAKVRGIDLTPAQLSDSRFMKWASSMLRSVPFTGAQGRYDAQVGALNRQLAAAIGEDAPMINSQVYAAAKQRQSNTFNELTERNALKVNDALIRGLTDVAERAKLGGGPLAEQVESAIDSLYSRATTGPNGVTIPGAAYQAFDAELNNVIKAGGAPAHFLGQVQSAVRRAMDESISPADAEAWRQVRREYGNRKTLAPLVAKAADGPISPASLMGAVTNSKSSKEAMASGSRGELGQLARIGQRMKEPPSSGTTERTFASVLMAGAPLVDPVTGTLSAIGTNLIARGMDSRLLARYMMRQNPGMTAEAAEQIIRAASNPTGQSQIAGRPLELDIVGGTPVPAAQLRHDLGL